LADRCPGGAVAGLQYPLGNHFARRELERKNVGADAREHAVAERLFRAL
jgi:hypothetical protein